MNKNTEQNYFLSLNKLKALKNEQCKKHHRVLNVEQVGLTGTIISHGGFPTHSQFDTESGTARVATQLCWLDYYNRWR